MLLKFAELFCLYLYSNFINNSITQNFNLIKLTKKTSKHEIKKKSF